MKNRQRKPKPDIAKAVRKRIEAGGERVWRLADFENLPFTAVAQALSRLFRLGIIQRLGKGLYYKPRQTAFGPSKPNPSQLRSLPISGKGVFPAGCTAANILGFTTQHPAKLEIATNGLSLPRLIVGKDTIIHTRRPPSWQELSYEDAAILEFLRQGGSFSEFSPKETVGKLLEYFDEARRFKHLLRVALTEPPRVRALLGAIGQQLGYSEKQLFNLRKSLNPLSRFDFGLLSALKYARKWQSREPSL
jgi:uncharacterized protein DUF6088